MIHIRHGRRARRSLILMKDLPFKALVLKAQAGSEKARKELDRRCKAQTPRSRMPLESS